MPRWHVESHVHPYPRISLSSRPTGHPFSPFTSYYLLQGVHHQPWQPRLPASTTLPKSSFRPPFHLLPLASLKFNHYFPKPSSSFHLIFLHSPPILVFHHQPPSTTLVPSQFPPGHPPSTIRLSSHHSPGNHPLLPSSQTPQQMFYTSSCG